MPTNAPLLLSEDNADLCLYQGRLLRSNGVKGWTKRFLRDLREHPGMIATRAGVVGYIARASSWLWSGSCS
ncbi:MAG: hypothetical protein ABI934_06105 [Actinomycetota bacterium]